MPILAFVRENARWLSAGFLLMAFSSFGQTFFIALSAGNIRAEYGLTNGQWGLLYMGATLASALTLPHLGKITDTHPTRTVTALIAAGLAVACLLMGLSANVILLAVTIYLLRLFGQGMMTLLSMTAVARWFSAQRGRALSVTIIGLNFGEAILPTTFVALAALAGWRNAWIAASGLLILVALPSLLTLTKIERTPRASDPAPKLSAVRDWTRGEALRDPAFYLLLTCVMGPPFIVTTILFHQVYLVELRGWSLEVFASTFLLSSTMTVVFALVSGALIDRFTGIRVLPFVLAPLGTGCLILAAFDDQWSAFAFMALFGISNGFSATLFGAIWPEVYGTRHLGSIRAATAAFLVLSSAIGPGITGWLIDAGVRYPYQIAAMGLYCWAIVPVMLGLSAHLRRRALQDERSGATPRP